MLEAIRNKGARLTGQGERLRETLEAIGKQYRAREIP